MDNAVDATEKAVKETDEAVKTVGEAIDKKVDEVKND